MNKTGLTIIVLSVIVIGVVAYKSFNVPKEDGVLCAQDVQMCADGSYVSRVAPSCEFAKCSEVLGKLNPTVYPLYNGVKWGSEASSTLNLKDQTLVGAEVTSEEIKNLSQQDISKTATLFQDYYFGKLNPLGWIQNINYSADGPSGSRWVYYKGSDYIVFTYNSEAVNKALNTPKTCPCNLKFTVFTGTIKK